MSDYQGMLIDDLWEETEELKRKLEIAVKGLKDVKEHMRLVGGGMAKYSLAYNLAAKCLKDLGVEG